MDKAQYVVGVDIGGTNIKVAAVTPDGEVLSRRSRATGSGRTEWLASIRECVDVITAERGGRPDALALAAPGLVANDGRSIAWMQGRLWELEHFDWSAAQNEKPVRVINDGHAATLGEAWIGAARGSRNVLMLTLGTGVGGGAIVDGRLLRGHLGRAGHVGHITLDSGGTPDIVGTPGSLEDAVGDCTIAKRSRGRFESTRDLVKALESGDDAAGELWSSIIQNLSAGMVSLINVFDPELIVVGGGISTAGRTLFEPLTIELNRIEWRPMERPVAVVAAQLGEWSGAIGAAKLALSGEEVLL